MDILTINEQILLLAIWRLADNAYGVTIRDKVIEMAQKQVVYGTLYNSLDKLVKKGYVTTSKGEPSHERGGRSKIYYSLSRDGKIALQRSKELQESLWEGVSDIVIGVSSS